MKKSLESKEKNICFILFEKKRVNKKPNID